MEHASLHERIVALEKENRRTKRWLAGLASLLAAVPLVGFAAVDSPEDASYRVVYASKFALRDPRTGKMRAELSHQTHAGGSAGITLWNPDGRPGAQLMLREDGRSHLSLGGGHERIQLTLEPDGTPSFVAGGETIELD